MKESVQQYVHKIEGKLAGQDPLTVQALTAKKLARLVENAPPARLRRRPVPDKWSPAEIIAHLADAEIVASYRVRAILGAPGTAIAAYDQDAWAGAGHYAERDVHACLEQFRVLRAGNLALYKTLTPEQWKLRGIHAERGEESVGRLVQMMAGHDINHLEQIEQILTGKRASDSRR